MNYFFQTPERFYLISPLLSGGHLGLVLKENGGKFPESQIKFYIAQIILGLSDLHKIGVMHRDVKLSNTMLDANGYLKLIDFGLSLPFE